MKTMSRPKTVAGTRVDDERSRRVVPRGRRRGELRRMPCLERLEDRQLLAIVSAVDAHGVLSVISNAADTIALGTNSLGDVTVNGAAPGTGAFLRADVTGIAIQGAGSNDIDFSAFQIASFPDLTTLTVDGGGGNSELLGPNASTDFYVTGPDAGVLGGTAFGSLSGTFQAIPNLTGGAAANDFLFSPGASLSGAIHGGASGDTLDLGAMNGPLSVVLTGSTGQGFQGTASFITGGFSNIATMNGPLDGGTLTGENLPSTWTLNDAPTYSDGTHTLAFQNFQTLQAGNGGDTFEIIGNAAGQVTANLVGGSGDDTFNFHGSAQLVGSLDGGGGFDTLSYAAFDGSVSVQITGSDAGGYSGTEGQTFSGGGFQGIDNIIASPSAAGSSILAGDDLTSTWDLGATQTYSDGSATPLSFSGFDTLQAGAGANTFNVLASSTVNLNGGAGNDSFVFSDGAVLDGSIDGQGGVNTLDLGGYHQATEVNLAAGTASVLDGTLANIQDVTGGTAADTITGDSADNTFISNGTSDVLVGGSGNDTNVLTLPANSSTSVTDNQGNNSLDFSRAGTGIVLNLDSTAMQTVASGRQLQIDGRFTNVIGTPFADEISVSATAYDRTISGGLADSVSGILQVDAGGRIASVTPTAVLIKGMGTIFYSDFSQVILVKQRHDDRFDLLRRDVGLRRVGDVHGHGDRLWHSDGHCDVLRRRGQPGGSDWHWHTERGGRPGRGHVQHLNADSEWQPVCDHGGLWRRRELPDQHIVGDDPDGQPGGTDGERDGRRRHVQHGPVPGDGRDGDRCRDGRDDRQLRRSEPQLQLLQRNDAAGRGTDGGGRLHGGGELHQQQSQLHERGQQRGELHDRAGDADGERDGRWGHVQHGPVPGDGATVTGVGTDGTIASFGDPSLSYSYYSGTTLLAGAPTAAGAYTVVANYTSNNPNYTNANSSPVSFTIGQATPTVSVTDAGGTYNTDPFPATGVTVTGVGTDGTIASFGDPSLSYSYYSGTTLLAGAPTAAGAYTVVANYTSDNANYTNASSSAVSFTIGQATPTVSVTDAGGTYNTDPFPATGATVTGVGTDGTIASFGDPSLSYSYYSGTTLLAGAPTAAGDYTVVANYTSDNANYTSASSSAVSFTIGQATPTVSVTDAGGTYNTDPFPATGATVTGVGTDGTIASFGDPSLSYSFGDSSLIVSYYSGTTLLAGAPTAAGAYTVVANYTSDNPNYTDADSSPVSFTIGQAAPTVSVTDAGGTYSTDPFPATDATVTGVGTDGKLASFGDPSLSYSYYSGATLLAGAPTAAGAYTVVANYTSDNPNYTNADSSPVSFTIGAGDADGERDGCWWHVQHGPVPGDGRDGDRCRDGRDDRQLRRSEPQLQLLQRNDAAGRGTDGGGRLHGGGELHQ